MSDTKKPETPRRVIDDRPIAEPPKYLDDAKVREQLGDETPPKDVAPPTQEP